MVRMRSVLSRSRSALPVVDLSNDLERTCFVKNPIAFWPSAADGLDGAPRDPLKHRANALVQPRARACKPGVGMYRAWFGLTDSPFSITPDPRFVFLSERHRDALAHLLYGIGQGGSGGFVQLTGEVGTGKTTISRLLLEQVPENTRIAMVLHPRQSPMQLLETITEELDIKLKSRRLSNKLLIDAIHQYLLQAYADGLRVVLIIDEAQNLSFEALEQIRLLTNLETATQKLLQILLLGQPELRAQLAKPELRQLAQRVTARYHLTPLSRHETVAYVQHRLAVAGARRHIITTLAMHYLHWRSGGVPRLINVIADRALVAGYVHASPQIGWRLMHQAAGEVFGDEAEPQRTLAWRRVLILATSLLVLLVGWALWR